MIRRKRRHINENNWKNVVRSCLTTACISFFTSTCKGRQEPPRLTRSHLQAAIPTIILKLLSVVPGTRSIQVPRTFRCNAHSISNLLLKNTRLAIKSLFKTVSECDKGPNEHAINRVTCAHSVLVQLQYQLGSGDLRVRYLASHNFWVATHWFATPERVLFVAQHMHTRLKCTYFSEPSS